GHDDDQLRDSLFDKINESDLQKLIFGKTNCSLYISKKSSKSKIKGVCIIYVDCIVFYPNSSKSDQLKILIREIVQVHRQRSYKIGEPHIVKIQTKTDTLFFTHWNQSIQQFFFSYWAKERIQYAAKLPRSEADPFTSMNIESSYAVADVKKSQNNQSVANGIDNMIKNAHNPQEELVYKAGQLFNILSDNYDVEHQLIFNKSSNYTLEQTFNSFFENTDIFKEIRRKSEEHSITFTGWHVDISGNLTSELSFHTSVKLFKDIVTFIKFQIIWPYIEGELLLVKSVVNFKNVPSAKNVSMSVFNLIYYDKDNRMSYFKIYAKLDIQGNILTTMPIKKAILSSYTKRSNQNYKIFQSSDDKINSDEYKSLKILDIPQEIIYDKESCTKRLRNLNCVDSGNSNYSVFDSDYNNESTFDKLSLENSSQNFNATPNSPGSIFLSNIQCAVSIFYPCIYILLFLFFVAFLIKLFRNMEQKLSSILSMIYKINEIDKNLKDIVDAIEKMG
ncbi:MAG: hypothetical protein MHMPM18_003990, partial [Marteilia pararefringens]